MQTDIEKHIDILDGVRVFSIGLVVWFHFWQQSWLTPRPPVEAFVRYGFVFVDMMILLSAFCNFYPYARSILLNEPWPDIRSFYIRRAARILPSYYLCLLIMALAALSEGSCRLDASFWKDLLAHITCTAPFFPNTYLSPVFSGVLWTVQIEVLYYILLPGIAKLFCRAPSVTCSALWLCGIVSANYIVLEKADKIRTLGNHMLTFAGCYANGMLLCMLYITLKRKKIDNRYTCLAASITVLCCIVHLSRMLKQLGTGTLQIIQLQQRFELSLVFSCFILALPFSCRIFRAVFANKLMPFLSGISYNLYIWHQYIAVKLKEYRIPYWEGEIPPNQTGGRSWMWKYQILIIAAALIAAVVITFFFEKPIRKWLLRAVSAAAKNDAPARKKKP